ncbi:MAG TPA: hypothetical protein VFM75_01675, partial [Modicisalibacter sp.]|nr:hypothetical protein [Modicisalibacter sp.]
GLQSALNDHERTRLLGPSEAMAGMAGNEPWTLRQPPLEADRHALTEAPFKLTVQHLQGIAAWRMRVMMQALASQYDIPLERLMGWSRQLQAMGFVGEHACIEGCQRLASLGIDGSIDKAHCMAIQSLDVSWQAKLAALEARLLNDRVSRVGEPQ